MRERSNPWLSYALHCWGLLRRKIPERVFFQFLEIYPYESKGKYQITDTLVETVNYLRLCCIHCKYGLKRYCLIFFFFFFFFFFFNTNLQVCRSIGRAGLNFLANLRRVTLSATAAAVPLSSHTYVPNSAVWSLVHLSLFLTLHTWWNIRFSLVPKDLPVF